MTGVRRLGFTAVDSEAEMISKREDPKTAGVIAGGRSYLEHMRDDLINLLKLYTPGGVAFRTGRGLGVLALAGRSGDCSL